MTPKIIGIDEVNYSFSIAGDCVVVGYLRLPGTRKVRGVKDSKQLTHKQRLALFGRLHERGVYAVELATVNEINRSGIYQARNFAILNAIKKINQSTSGDREVIIDGYFSELWLHFFRTETNMYIECMVNGDEKIYEISAASIIARVVCDALFEGFGKFFPGYGYEHDHGSPSRKHIEALRRMGPSPYHRTGKYAKGWWERILKG